MATSFRILIRTASVLILNIPITLSFVIVAKTLFFAIILVISAALRVAYLIVLWRFLVSIVRSAILIILVTVVVLVIVEVITAVVRVVILLKVAIVSFFRLV